MVESWVDTFKMPYREIEKRFRKSELYLLSWRSQEKSIAFQKKIKKPENPSLKSPVPTGMPTDEWGGPAMDKMTGEQQLGFLRAQGLVVPVVLPRK